MIEGGHKDGTDEGAKGERLVSTRTGGQRRSGQGKRGRRAHDATIHPRRAQQIRTSVELLVVLMVDANVCAEITLAKTTLSSCNHALVSVLD